MTPLRVRGYPHLLSMLFMAKIKILYNSFLVWLSTVNFPFFNRKDRFHTKSSSFSTPTSSLPEKYLLRLEYLLLLEVSLFESGSRGTCLPVIPKPVRRHLSSGYPWTDSEPVTPEPILEIPISRLPLNRFWTGHPWADSGDTFSRSPLSRHWGHLPAGHPWTRNGDSYLPFTLETHPPHRHHGFGGPVLDTCGTEDYTV